MRGAEGRLYTHGRRLLVLAVNPTDAPVEASIRVDPRAVGGPDGPVRATTYGLNGDLLDDRRLPGDGVECVVRLAPDDLCAVEVTAPDAAPGEAPRS